MSTSSVAATAKAAHDQEKAEDAAALKAAKERDAELDPAVKKRVDEINAELGKLEGDRRDALKHLEEARLHSVEYAQSEVDRLRAQTDALAAEREKLLPAPPRDTKADEAGAALLKKNGWIKNADDTYTNTRHINSGNFSCPVGVTRPLDEAVGLESRRPL